jgi:hypothetical protein
LGILQDIKKRIALKKLNKVFLGSKRIPMVCKLSDAKSVGILYEATSEHEFKTVKDFVLKLKKSIPKVRSLGYVDKKELENFHIQPIEFGFFCKKDLDWYGNPKADSISDFIENDYDILIDLQLAETIPLKFISAISKSGFKAGRKPLREPEIYDLMLDVKPYVSLQYFIEQMTLYLNMINKS